MDAGLIQLLGLSVLAGLTGAIENVFVKPILELRFPNSDDPQDKKRWSVAVNLTTLAVATLLSFIALAGLNRFTSVEFAQSFVTSVEAAMIAIGGYNLQSNVRKMREDNLE